MQDLVAGQIDLIVADLTTSLPQVRAGSVKPYAFTGLSRSAAAPDVPTADEAGLPGFYTSVWSAIWAPKGHAEARHRQAQRSDCRGSDGSSDPPAARGPG